MSQSSNELRQALNIGGSEEKKKKSKILLWHRRLGQASFGYMKKLFPNLFANFDVSSFKCDVCELAKIHRASFLISTQKVLF